MWHACMHPRAAHIVYGWFEEFGSYRPVCMYVVNVLESAPVSPTCKGLCFRNSVTVHVVIGQFE